MEASPLLFYLIAGLTVTFAGMVVLNTNPIFSALSLAATMIMLAFNYFLLGAPFIAAVQLIIYAGAVMVLFVMVLMLFDLKKEVEAFTRGAIRSAVVVVSCGLLVGYFSRTIVMSTEMILSHPATVQVDSQAMSTKALAAELFTKYLFAFEVLGLLLLLVAIGVVAVSRSKGGTHAADS